MKTDELVRMLAAQAAPVPPRAARRRLGAALLAGALLSLALLLATLGPRPDLAQALREEAFWLKQLYALALAGIAFALAQRLARPGMAAGAPARLLWLPPAALAVLALAVLAVTSPEARGALLLGRTWRSCPFNIVLMALPLLGALLWGLKGLAPTRPGAAGAATGLLAGGLGTAVYALHCPESGVPFIALWYGLGMALSAALGALAGVRLLRW